MNCNKLKDFHVRHLLKAAKSILEFEKDREPSGGDNKIRAVRHKQKKTYNEEMKADRERSRDNLAGLKASSSASQLQR